MKKQSKLTAPERDEIALSLATQVSLRAIARNLNRSQLSLPLISQSNTSAISKEGVSPTTTSGIMSR